MGISMRSVCAVLWLLLSACSMQGQVAPLATPDARAIPDSRGAVVDGKLVAAPPLPGLRFAPSEGVCAPPRQPVSVTACCGGNACNGHCVAGAAGLTECSCFGRAGGCPTDMTCSKVSLKCVKVDDVKPR